jgi:sn-1 stearoyl-lipid 9-desaturase
LKNIQKKQLEFAWVNFFFIVGIHILALIGLFCGFLGYIPQFFGLKNIIAFFILYYITGCLGITLGYHRLLTHKSFKTTPWIEFYIDWISDHRTHHANSDQDGDKHNSNHGFIWSHIGWIFYKHPISAYEKQIREKLLKNPALIHLKSNVSMVLLQIALTFILYEVGGFGMVVWGILIRLVFVWHVTWLINSATHKWGYQLFDTSDNSTNNWITALLAFGEGWHNNHHAHESSPRHGLMWWELDVTWWHIWALEKIGLAWDLKPIPPLPKQ